jgi:hypothetical protein
MPAVYEGLKMGLKTQSRPRRNLDSFGGNPSEMSDLLFVDDVRRHDVDNVAKRPKQNYN